MSKTIFFFAKIFDNAKYADDFVNGNLYSNRLSFFRKIEESEQANRGDKHEGIVSWLQPEQIKLEINGLQVDGMAGPISIRVNNHDNLNIFCMYSAHCEVTDFEDVNNFRRQIELPEECMKLGQFAVLVLNVEKFFERVSKSVKDNNLSLTAGLVEYYDPKTFNGSFSAAESVFRKRDEYKHQKEYRFAFDTGVDGDNALVLNIGDISDITLVCKAADINRLIDIKVSDCSA